MSRFIVLRTVGMRRERIIQDELMIRLRSMKSVFRYPGGKSKTKVQKLILGYKPANIKEFREPFVGGGGIFFGLQPNPLIKRWINDKNEDLISVYLAFRDHPDEFIEACRAIPPMQPNEPEVPTKTANGAKYNKRLGEVFQKFVEDPTWPALRYFFINRTVWGGRVDYDRPSRLYYSNPEGWNITAKEGFLEEVTAHIAGTKITSGSYEQLLLEPGKDVWVYLDPPYYVDTNFTNTDKLYAFGFTKEDHLKFAQTCKASKHKLCISYDDDPFIIDLYEKMGFHIYKHEWTYSGAREKGHQEIKRKVGQELIITNYEKPGEQLPLNQEYEEVDICSNL